jgi:hypothetical protein
MMGSDAEPSEEVATYAGSEHADDDVSQNAEPDPRMSLPANHPAIKPTKRNQSIYVYLDDL